MQITAVGLDIAKNLFQVHGADAPGRVLLKRKSARGKVLESFATLPACLVGLDTGAGQVPAPIVAVTRRAFFLKQ
jgi:transposase